MDFKAETEKEIAVMRETMAALLTLDPAARYRVLRWAWAHVEDAERQPAPVASPP